MLRSSKIARRAGSRAVAVWLALALTGAAAAADIGAIAEPQPVSLYLNVEKKGGLITGLTQENFRLREDGQVVPFRLEQPETPASIAVLMEYSQASAYFTEDLTASMEGFLKYAPEGHWYALATYSHGLEVRADFTRQIGEIRQSFAELGEPMWSEVDTYDAIYDMLDSMGRLPGRRILIVVGSGVDTFSRHMFEDVQKKIESENVTVFVVGLGSLFRGAYDPYLTDSGRMSLLQSEGFLRMLAKKSGGFAWFPNQVGAYPPVMEGIMQSVGTQYRLVYQSGARGSGKFHKLAVEAFRVVNDKRENFQVLVREGWR